MQTDAMIVSEFSRGFQGLTEPAVGIYCLQPDAVIDPAKKPAVVSPELAYSQPGAVLFAYAFVARDACPKTSFEVRTYVLNTRFQLVPNDRVAFTIVVP